MAVNLFTCGICLEDVRIPEGKQVSDYKHSNLAFTGDQALSDTLEPVATKCDHVFHSSCLKTWIDSFLNKNSVVPCPGCRLELLPPHSAPENINNCPSEPHIHFGGHTIPLNDIIRHSHGNSVVRIVLRSESEQVNMLYIPSASNETIAKVMIFAVMMQHISLTLQNYPS